MELPSRRLAHLQIQEQPQKLRQDLEISPMKLLSVRIAKIATLHRELPQQLVQDFPRRGQAIA
jgi:hypothetical protein